MADPSVGKGDLMAALERFYEEIGTRNIGDICQKIKDAKVTWKTAAKAQTLLLLAH